MRNSTQNHKEEWAIYLGWAGFVVTFLSLFLPWYTQPGGIALRPTFFPGLSTSYSTYLIIGTLAIIGGLLSSTAKPSTVSIAFLGAGALTNILMAGWFLSNYYEQAALYVIIIQNIQIGSFITIIGGIITLTSAILYSLHVRRQTSESKTQLSSPTA